MDKNKQTVANLKKHEQIKVGIPTKMERHIWAH